MTIADEMDVPLDKVKVTLADARPELVWNQLTGGSNSMHSIYTPVRVAAAIARGSCSTPRPRELGDVAVGAARSSTASSPRRTAARSAIGDADHEGSGGELEARRARASSRSPSSSSSARHSAASTPSTSSPAASSSRWTSTSRARCRRWCAARRRSTASRARSRNLAAVEAMPGHHRRGDHPAHAQRRRRRRGARQDVRPVHRRRPRAEGRLGPGHRRRQVRRERARRPEEGRAARPDARPLR